MREQSAYQRLCDLIDIEPTTQSMMDLSIIVPTQVADLKKNERITAAMQVLVNMIIETNNTVERLDKELIDSFIAKIDELISAQLDIIVHHEAFQELESSWRGLQYLVERTDFRSNTRIHLLDVDKETLRLDFEDVPDIVESGLYKHIYEQEYDMPGGKPISAIISDFEFNSSHVDISLLTEISKVAASSHCPFLASVGARFFGKASMEDVSKITDLPDYMDRAEYTRWNSFRDSDNSRYIGLVLPKFLLRLPYGEANPVKGFCYQETVASVDHQQFCWGNATFAFASNLNRSFKQHGWTVSIRGPEAGGKVDNLALHQYDVGRGIETKIPTEILIPETRELEFAELGFIPFSYYKDSHYACFFSANSVNRPVLYDSPEATANSRINSRLPYIFLAARLGHYLKVLQRENIGGAKDRMTLEKELNRWLSTLVTQMPNPGPELLASRPLREGKVIVENIRENPGFYKVNLYAMPHFQVEGIDVRLSLVAQMPTKDNHH